MGIQVADELPSGEVYSAENRNQQAIPWRDQLFFSTVSAYKLQTVPNTLEWPSAMNFNGRSTPKQQLPTAAKASSTLGFLRRNLSDCSKQVWLTTYKSMVRPTMEYASSSSDPYKTEDADNPDKVSKGAKIRNRYNQVPQVQCRTASYACNNYTERTQGCVTAMVNSLGWETLQDHRKTQC